MGWLNVLSSSNTRGGGWGEGQMLSKPVFYPHGPPESSSSVRFHLSHLGLLCVPKGVVWHCRSFLCFASRGNLEIWGSYHVGDNTLPMGAGRQWTNAQPSIPEGPLRNELQLPVVYLLINAPVITFPLLPASPPPRLLLTWASWDYVPGQTLPPDCCLRVCLYGLPNEDPV